MRADISCCTALMIVTSHHESQAKTVHHRRDSFISFLNFFLPSVGATASPSWWFALCWPGLGFLMITDCFGQVTFGDRSRSNSNRSNGDIKIVLVGQIDACVPPYHCKNSRGGSGSCRVTSQPQQAHCARCKAEIEVGDPRIQRGEDVALRITTGDVCRCDPSRAQHAGELR